MTSTGYTLYLQQRAGKYEDSEESDFSQESEVSSQGTESSQEETENLAHRNLFAFSTLEEQDFEPVQCLPALASLSCTSVQIPALQ